MSELTNLRIDEIKARLAQRLRELKAEIRDALIQSDRRAPHPLSGASRDRLPGRRAAHALNLL